MITEDQIKDILETCKCSKLNLLSMMEKYKDSDDDRKREFIWKEFVQNNAEINLLNRILYNTPDSYDAHEIKANEILLELLK